VKYIFSLFAENIQLKLKRECTRSIKAEHLKQDGDPCNKPRQKVKEVHNVLYSSKINASPSATWWRLLQYTDCMIHGACDTWLQTKWKITSNYLGI